MKKWIKNEKMDKKIQSFKKRFGVYFKFILSFFLFLKYVLQTAVINLQS